MTPMAPTRPIRPPNPTTIAAAMGVSADDVTDPQLRVRGTRGLRIADASVLPVQVSGNTGAPAMLVGYRAADLILDDL